MVTDLVPVKTEAGHAELARRERRLSQRHRTVLLLVDGKRTVREVLQTAAAAGVPGECFNELVAMGLIGAAGGAGDDAEDSLLPAAASLLPESGLGELDEPAVDPPPGGTPDAPLKQARELLAHALRNEAPVSGTLTLMKLRRAGTRQEVAALLDEIEQRIRKPRKQIITAQLMRQVRHLLSLPPE